LFRKKMTDNRKGYYFGTMGKGEQLGAAKSRKRDPEGSGRTGGGAFEKRGGWEKKGTIGEQGSWKKAQWGWVGIAEGREVKEAGDREVEGEVSSESKG